MSGDSKAGEFRNPSDQRLEALLSGMKRVAVVGISPKEDRASHGIARFLVNLGIEVVGVNPMQSEPVLGCPVYASLEDVPGPVDIVDVFRRSDAVPPIVEAAIARKDGCVWMQEGVVHEEAADQAQQAGLDVVMDLCLYKEWLRLMNH